METVLTIRYDKEFVSIRMRPEQAIGTIFQDVTNYFGVDPKLFYLSIDNHGIDYRLPARVFVHSDLVLKTD
jgi:hypothetical protein